MSDWGYFEITFNCNKNVFDSIQSILFKEYDGKLKLNFDSFIDDFDGDSTKYDSAFRFWLPEYFEIRDNGFQFYCGSLPLLQYLIIRISELINYDFDVYINHPSYQSSIFYQIRNQKLSAAKVVGYYGQCGPEYCELCIIDGIDEFGDIEWHCNEECVPWTFYDGDTGFEKLKKRIGYNEE